MFLTPEQVAERLQVSAQTVRKWLRADKLRGDKAGKQWRISEQALRRFIKQRDHGGPVAALWPCTECGGVLRPETISWTIDSTDGGTLMLACPNKHYFTVKITQEQFDRGRDGDFGWLRGQ